MNEDFQPRWISKEETLYIHAEVIKAKGGLSGMRDEGLLDSALARPQNFHAYGEIDIFALAAPYAEGVARNHPFADGNKRTAYAVADMFLYENGYDLNQEKELEQTTLFENLAQGTASREDVAEFYRQNTQKL